MNPVSKHQIQPEYGDEQADAGRDCRTRLASKFSGANGDREILFFPVQLTTSRIGYLTRLFHTLAIRDDNTYIQEHRMSIYSVESPFYTMIAGHKKEAVVQRNNVSMKINK